ncbi:diaminopimelate dehydrogenase [Mitsuokella jalaludinii]|uniref:diaminopimelate dehydrogenase n=2 Tax=Mitsuokella jalaludinii TaxID=187979 RepID=UPI001D0100B9|nr:diaminopimelate dehydrogenase [Mitsuokella jalaludinii]MCB5723918.1 diaminopimelate dehydrogenase [Mitsuokella jalaludinii]
MSIRIGILGYGNLGRGVECAVEENPDMELVAVFTRRDPSAVKIWSQGVPVVNVKDVAAWQDKIDVMILCGGSATDLPKQTPEYAKYFNVIDSFDTHARIPEHFADVDKAAKESGHLGIISVGWDPGLFSLARVYSNAILPDGKDYTFWGKGVSQGHSDAIRRIKGVKDAKQYTVPVESALAAVRSGSNPELTTRQKHTRECFVVLEEGADAAYVENAIKTMPNYFDEYDTTVHFISEEELQRDHSGLAHGGFVIRSGATGHEKEHNHIIEFSLKLDSNPEFTTSVLVAYARAAYRLAKEGQTGCRTVLDIAPAYLCEQSGEELRAHLL